MLFYCSHTVGLVDQLLDTHVNPAPVNMGDNAESVEKAFGAGAPPDGKERRVNDVCIWSENHFWVRSTRFSWSWIIFWLHQLWTFHTNIWGQCTCVWNLEFCFCSWALRIQPLLYLWWRLPDNRGTHLCVQMWSGLEWGSLWWGFLRYCSRFFSWENKLYDKRCGHF